MRTIYEIGPDGRWTGAARQIDDADGFAPGWTPAAPPVLSNGEAAYWTHAEWVAAAAPAPAPPPGTVQPSRDIPPQVTMWQARTVLGLTPGPGGGSMVDAVDAAISGLPEAEQNAARAQWEYAPNILRSAPFVTMMAGALGLSADETDALFIEAAAVA